MKSNIEQRRIVAYLDSVQARLASLRELQSATDEELRLRTLLPSVLARVMDLRGRMAEAERQVEGLFEALLTQVFDRRAE